MKCSHSQKNAHSTEPHHYHPMQSTKRYIPNGCERGHGTCKWFRAWLFIARACDIAGTCDITDPRRILTITNCSRTTLSSPFPYV